MVLIDKHSFFLIHNILLVTSISYAQKLEGLLQPTPYLHYQLKLVPKVILKANVLSVPMVLAEALISAISSMVSVAVIVSLVPLVFVIVLMALVLHHLLHQVQQVIHAIQLELSNWFIMHLTALMMPAQVDLQLAISLDIVHSTSDLSTTGNQIQISLLLDSSMVDQPFYMTTLMLIHTSQSIKMQDDSLCNKILIIHLIP